MSNEKKFAVARVVDAGDRFGQWWTHDTKQGAVDQAVYLSKGRPGTVYHVLETKYIVTTPAPVIKELSSDV